MSVAGALLSLSPQHLLDAGPHILPANVRIALAGHGTVVPPGPPAYISLKTI
jgi:hypothetical protein